MPMSNSAARAAVVNAEFGDDRQSELKLFTLWNQGVPPPFATLDQARQVETKKLCRANCNPERWWVITISSLEAVRISAAPLAPLSRAALTQAPGTVQSTRHRARIGWGRAGQGHSVDVDIGAGLRLGIEGNEVDVHIVGPRGRMREPSKGDTRTLGDPGVGGLYVDSLISAHIVPSPCAPSARRPSMTQIVNVLPGTTDQSIVVPPFARMLTVTHQGTANNTVYSFRIGLTGPPLHTTRVTETRSSRVLVPHAATHVTSGPPRPFARVLTFQWELDL